MNLNYKESINILEWLGFKSAPCDDSEGSFWYKEGYQNIDDDDSLLSPGEWINSPVGQEAIKLKINEVFRPRE